MPNYGLLPTGFVYINPKYTNGKSLKDTIGEYWDYSELNTPRTIANHLKEIADVVYRNNVEERPIDVTKFRPIVLLKDIYEASSSGLNDWPQYRMVIDLATDLVGPNLNGWFYTQAINPRISYRNLEFILDTCLYIAKGERRFSSRTWVELMKGDANLSSKGVDTPKLRTKILETLRDHQFSYSNWLGRRGGADDLLNTLYVIFASFEVAVREGEL